MSIISLGLAENYAVLGNTYLDIQTAGTVKGFMGSNFLSYPPNPNLDSNGIRLIGSIPNAPIVNGATAKQAIADVNTAISQYLQRPEVYNDLAPFDLNSIITGPGRYTINGNLITNVDVTLRGSATDMYVFISTGSIEIMNNITLSGDLLPQNVIFIASKNMFLGGSDLSTKYGIYISTSSSFANIEYTNLIGRLICPKARASIFSSATITAPQFA